MGAEKQAIFVGFDSAWADKPNGPGAICSIALSGDRFSGFSPWGGPNIALPQLSRTGSALLESDAVKRSMAGLPRDWSAYANRIPLAGIVANENQNNRLDSRPLRAGGPQ
jgi:hypothetical protein